MKLKFALFVLCLLVVVGFLGIRIFGGPDCEGIARKGAPIAQAISDFRSDHGLLPEMLDDLVPEYLKTPPERGWSFNGFLLSRYTGVDRTYVCYDFAEANVWYARGEAESRKLQTAAPVKKPGLSGEALLSARLAEYERRINRKPGEHGWYEAKINLLGWEKRTGLLREECERDAGIFPNWWLPQMALAELDITNLEAGTRFTNWVNTHPSFINYWYLAWYFKVQSNFPAAFDALDHSFDCDFWAYPKDASMVGSAYAFEAAKFAYENHNYGLTLKICKQWGTLGDSYGGQEWHAFEAAVEIALGQFDAALNDAKQANNRPSSWANNVSTLLRAAEKHDSHFVYDAGETQNPWTLFQEPVYY